MFSRDVRREDGAQPVLRAGHALRSGSRRCSRSRRRSSRSSARRAALGHAGRPARTHFRRSARRRARLARPERCIACAPGAPARGASSAGRGRPWAAGGRPSAPARACGSRRPAARPPPSCGSCARTLAHARPVTACHSQGPPQLAVGGRPPVRVVLQHRHALDRRLGEPHGLVDPRHSPIAEFSSRISTASSRARSVVHERGQDSLDLDVRVELLAHHRRRGAGSARAWTDTRALRRDDHLVGRREGDDRKQPEAGRRVDEDEVVVLEVKRTPSSARARVRAHHRHGDLRPGQVDRRARDVDLALADDLTDGEADGRASYIDASRCPGRCPGSS